MSYNTLANVVRLFPLAVLLTPEPTFAQMTPLEDLRTNSAHVFYQTTGEDFRESTPPVPFAHWEDQTVGIAEVYQACEDPPPDSCLVGSCTGTAYQNSEFFPAGIQFSGATGAHWGIPPVGIYLVRSISGFKFKIDNTLDYDLFVIVDPGDSPVLDGTWAGEVSLEVFNSAGDATELHGFTIGQQQVTGRLGPGTYKLEGFSMKSGNWESFQGAFYFAQWTVHEPQAPHIAVQPSDRATACGGSVVLSAGTALSPANYTFQWRRNFVPLTDGPNVTGATTSTLTLTNVCSAADYDVVVTGPNPAGGGPIAEPSRLAHLTIVAPTGVETEPTSPATVIRAPAPNPFRVSTTVEYDVHQPMRLVAAVYNASGARVRSLVDQTISSSGSITWDGRLHSGARAPVGIYFLRLELDGLRQTRKVVLLE
jgi:hypothetical protein